MRHCAPMLLACLLIAVITAACNKNPSQNTNQNADQPTVIVPPPVSPRARRYHLKGKVVSVDKQSKMLNVDGEAIPDFMAAMTMPYEVKPESELDKLKPGDVITADVVMQGEKAWLENITVAQPSKAERKSQ
jgi:Cu/Ag efflux protein CusF